MKSEKPASYYDAFFQSESGFQVPYKESFYFVHWTQVIVFLKRISCPRILEIGCGTGQLAEYLHDEGFTDYHGFDFSAKAVELARLRVNLDFFQGNALDNNSYSASFNTVICLEVLEHIKEDISVLKRLPNCAHIIFSVPNFDAPSHVRWFTSARQVKLRYFRHVEIREIIRVGNIYICRGMISPFKPNIFQSVLASREEVGLSSITKRLKHRAKNLLKLKTAARS